MDGRISETAGEYRSVELYVDGESVGEHALDDDDTFSFTV
jgi:hypothetical protein